MTGAYSLAGRAEACLADLAGLATHSPVSGCDYLNHSR
jgi:hypothetical protein